VKHRNSLVLFSFCLVISVLFADVSRQVGRYGLIGGLFWVLLSAFVGFYLPAKILFQTGIVVKRVIVERRNNHENQN